MRDIGGTLGYLYFSYYIHNSPQIIQPYSNRGSPIDSFTILSTTNFLLKKLNSTYNKLPLFELMLSKFLFYFKRLSTRTPRFLNLFFLYVFHEGWFEAPRCLWKHAWTSIKITSNFLWLLIKPFSFLLVATFEKSRWSTVPPLSRSLRWYDELLCRQHRG